MAGRVIDVKKQLEESLRDENKPWTSVLSTLERKTGVDRLYVFIGTIAVVGLWLVFGYAAQLLCNAVGFLYPAYVSIHALESPTKEDDTRWLTYWVVFAVFSVVEYFADIIVGWFPLYWLAKCVFFVWLMIPTDYNGASIIYSKVLRQYFLRHHQQIDKTMSHVRIQEQEDM